MAWDWVEKGAKRLQELGGEYKQHHALIERLLTLDPAAAPEEMTRAWQAMDDRARAGLKMTLAGLTLSQQAAPSSVEAKRRLERLKALQTLADQASQGTPRTAQPASTEATFTAGAARVTNKLADVAERARPKVAAAVKAVITELKADPPAREPVVPPPIPEDRPPTPAASAATTLAGQWSGDLRRAGGDDSIGCDLRVAASGNPTWSYHDTNGFQQKELTHAGQRFQYIPPGGGVATVAVQSVTRSATETGYVVDYSFEGSSNGYLTQKYQRLMLAGRLRESWLDVTYSETGISSFGDKTGLAATEGAAEYRGALTKQP